MSKRGNSVRRGGSGSKKIYIMGTEKKSVTRPGRALIERRALGQKAVAEHRRAGEEELRTRLQSKFF